MSEQHPLIPRIDSMEQRMERIESKLDTISQLDVAIRELGHIASTFGEQQKATWQRIDEINKWRESHDRLDFEAHTKIIESANRNVESIEETAANVEKKVDEWINKAKGIGTVIAWVGGVFQVIIITLVGWQFTTTYDNSIRMTQLETKLIAHIEGISKADADIKAAKK